MTVSIIFYKGKYHIEKSHQEMHDTEGNFKLLPLYLEAFIDNHSVKKEEFLKQYRKDYPGRLPKKLRKII